MTASSTTPAFPLFMRVRSARFLAIALGAQAAAAVVLAWEVLSVPREGAFPPLLLFVGHLGLFGLALVAAVFELNRERYAEALALPCAGLGMVLTMLAIISGWYITGPVLLGVTLAVSIGLANRFTVRDEPRHLPHV